MCWRDCDGENVRAHFHISTDFALANQDRTKLHQTNRRRQTTSKYFWMQSGSKGRNSLSCLSVVCRHSGQVSVFFKYCFSCFYFNLVNRFVRIISEMIRHFTKWNRQIVGKHNTNWNNHPNVFAYCNRSAVSEWKIPIEKSTNQYCLKLLSRRFKEKMFAAIRKGCPSFIPHSELEIWAVFDVHGAWMCLCVRPGKSRDAINSVNA